MRGSVDTVLPRFSPTVYPDERRGLYRNAEDHGFVLRRRCEHRNLDVGLQVYKLTSDAVAVQLVLAADELADVLAHRDGQRGLMHFKSRSDTW